MTMNPLPPQAYTKEMLTQAYNWLRTQPPNIQELAKSTDTLISLYHKAQMHGDAYLDRPSLQNFKSELKNLAGLMVEFDSKNAQFQSSSFSVVPPIHVNGPGFTAQQPQMAHSYAQPVNAPPIINTPPLQPSLPSANLSLPASPQLDSKSMTMLEEVREALNLSSDCEAMRMLVSIGYQKIKSIL